jgi:transposase
VTRIICGVDVSSGTLDCRIGTDGPELRVKNNSEGIEELAEFCRHHGVELVAMEATGGYERLAFGLLWAKDLPCAVLNPRAVRQFAQAMGYLEKTDRIDAGVIAWFAQVKRIVGQPPASRTQQRLRALVSRLAQLTLLSSAQKNQRRLVSDVEVLASIDEILAAVRRQIRLFENKIAELLDSDPLWRALDRVLRSIKGVADRTVARLMAELPEIGTISNKAAAKLIGLAPIARDSGNASRARSVRGGRRAVRDVLVVVATVVCRYDPDFIAFKQKLKKAGKTPMVIRVAAARKLLVRLNAKARDLRRELAFAA